MKIKKILCLLFLSYSLVLFGQNNNGKEAEHRNIKNLIETGITKYPFAKNQGGDNKGKVEESLEKAEGHSDRKYYIMNGNKITTQVTNYGGIAPGYGLIRNVSNVVWKKLSYVFQFSPIVGAAVTDENGKKVHIISDGLNDYMTSSYHLQETNPTYDTLWQWQPLSGYADPESECMASNPAPDKDGDGKPDSWPREWYNPTLGEYVWPGYLSQNSTNADQEVFWAMDDRDNMEFDYYPFKNDRKRKGLGIQIDGRAFQWSNALAENTIFFVYTITNTSDTRLDSVFFGIYGDPDIGGGSPENKDDEGFFVPPYSLDTLDISSVPVYARSLVYFWDQDMKGDFGLPLGYLGCKFLESPGNPEDGEDNDGDGLVDERQDDGIDNDGDWDPNIHDVGIDGVPNTGDLGEGDGVPTAGIIKADGSPDPLYPGEPNFEYTDLDESDQIGLTSFNSWTWNQDNIANDESMWNRSIPGNFGAIQRKSDIVFIFGSGYISLDPGETKRISTALICGENLDDLLTSAETVQKIYNNNYQFYKPPKLPTVKAVPGDKKVTLYWDTQAENSIDPIGGRDFEGYVIYRSTDPSFSDIQKVTDGRGSSFLCEPLKDVDGNDAKFDVATCWEPFSDLNKNGIWDKGEPFVDLNKDQLWSQDAEDPWKGYHPIQYTNRGIHYYLGDNSGLIHSYVDSNNVVNGQTYYYAVVAYDHGDSTIVPVSETTKKITIDPITSEITFDPNTVMVVPGPRANGYIAPNTDDCQLEHIAGISTSKVTYEIIDDLKVMDQGKYELIVSDEMAIGRDTVKVENYSILNTIPRTEIITLFGKKYADISEANVLKDEIFSVASVSGEKYLENTDYVVNYSKGAIKRTDDSKIDDQEKVVVTYRYYPIRYSTLMNDEDSNPVFDGIKLKVNNEALLEPDTSKCGWVEGVCNLDFEFTKSSVNVNQTDYPADYEISFSNDIIDSAFVQDKGLVKTPVKYSVKDITNGVPVRIPTFLNEKANSRNKEWNPGDEICFFTQGATGTVKDTLTWGVRILAKDDSNEVIPGAGDVLVLRTKRPLAKSDKYSLTTKAGKVIAKKSSDMLDNIYVVPNPYLGYSSIEPTNKLPGQSRGERRIYFENLPQKCTIRIYTLSGDPVNTLYHDSGVSNGREYWNLLNRDGFGVGYGVYVAHIDAPGIGEKLVKFALIK